jgi:ESS family glutamate:Na+ symporter
MQLGELETIIIAILVLFLGKLLTRKVRFLQEYNIPEPVSGGLIASLAFGALYFFYDLEFRFALEMRDTLLIVFFTTIGLSSRFKTLVQGGKPLLILLVIAVGYLFLQNFTGIAVAYLTGLQLEVGVIGGSVSLSGGHGTAIAWGQVAEDAGLEGAAAIGLAFATFGLVVGGMVGGPIARRLIEKRGITGPGEGGTDDTPATSVNVKDGEGHDWLFHVLISLLMLALCVSLGHVVNRLLAEDGLLLPGFLTSMFVGIVIANIADVFKHPLNDAVVGKFGDVSLNIFLSMSMMAIQLWTLAAAAKVIMVVLVFQVLLMTIFAIYVVFRVMGRDYDAVVIAAGFAGLGLGATPVAIANMNAITSKYGPSSKAFLVVPLVGAFFIDLLNAGTINFFIGVIDNWLL